MSRSLTTPALLRRGGAVTALLALLIAGQAIVPAAVAAGTASLSGVVTDAVTHEPVADVSVSWCNTIDECSETGVTTGADGRYSFTDLAAARYTLYYYPESSAYASGSVSVRVSEAQAATKDVALAPAGSISGTVLDSSGSPIPDSRVRILNDTQLFWLDVDETGHYDSAAIPVGTYTVSFYATGYMTQSWNGVLGADDGTPVTVVAGQASSGISAVLLSAASVSGVVRAPSGLPLAGVMYGYVDALGVTLTGSTAANGSYRITGLAPGTRTLSFSGTAPYLTTTVDATLAEGENTRDVTLDVGAVITGTVSGPSGPLSGAAVALVQKVTGGYSRTDTSTDSAGHYTFEGVLPGSYSLVVQGVAGLVDSWWPGVPDISQATPIVVTVGQRVENLDMHLGSAVTIWGTVVGSDAKTVGLPGVRVDVSIGGAVIASAITDAEGRYAVGGLTTGGYTLRFVPQAGSRYLGQWWNGSTTEAGATKIQVTTGTGITSTTNPQLVVAASISGTVTGADDAAPLVGAGVQLYSFTSQSVVASTTTDASGRYSFGSLVAGSYGIDVTPPTGSPYAEEWLANARSSSAATRIALAKGQILDGQDVTLGRWFTATPTPTIAGIAAVGATLTASAGAWGPGQVDLAYQWYRGSAVIPGAMAQSYTAVAADQGAKLSVQVTGTERGYNPVTMASAATATIALALTTVDPTISGTAAVGETLTAVPGAWGPGSVTLTYQWMRNGVAVSGSIGTRSTYVVTAADLGAVFSVAVTGKRTSYATVTLTSASTAVIAAGTLTPTVLPTITGTPSVGQALTGASGTWAPASGVTLSTRWERDGVAIIGATGTSYTLTNGDAGHAITFVVVAEKTAYATASATSAATAMVTGGTITTVVPTISGIAKVGQTLGASPGIWSPAPLALTYQWTADGQPIVGATGLSYTLTEAERGAVISITVTAAKTGFTTASETAAVTGPVAATPVQTLSESTLNVGDSLTVGGSGYEPGERVEAWLHSTPVLLGAGIADARGAVTFAVTVPVVASGAHRIEMRGAVSGSTFSDVTISARGALVVTGQDVGGLVLGAMLALLLGTGIVAGARRRRSLLG